MGNGGNAFSFTGGVTSVGNGGTVKFLMFLLNGNKEVALWDAKKMGFVVNDVDLNSVSSRTAKSEYKTDCSIVKIFLSESNFGSPNFTQSFFLALGSKLQKQVVTIQPKNLLARGRGYKFVAEASFLKKSEVFALLDSDSLSFKMFARQDTPSLDVLREIISIERFAPAPETKAMSHGGVRFIRI
jgi:hypothetical protein